MKKNKISKNWVNKQRKDIYVRKSKVDGYRARSAYKLIEINEKFKIFKGGMIVLDIGAAPGSWSQYASKIIKNGKIISIDLKEMEEIKGTIQIKGDFTDPNIQKKIRSYKTIDWCPTGHELEGKILDAYDNALRCSGVDGYLNFGDTPTSKGFTVLCVIKSSPI